MNYPLTILFFFCLVVNLICQCIFSLDSETLVPFLSVPTYFNIINKKSIIDNFLTFPANFEIPIIFSNLNSNCPDLSDLRNLQEQVKKAFCHQKLFWPFTVRINCSSDLKNFANSMLSASNFSINRKMSSHSWSEQFW